MIYAMSDIHGYYDKYQTMLGVIKFTADDTLYVLGDVLDRGPDGFKILWDMAQRPNVVLNTLEQRSQGGRYERSRNQEHLDCLSESNQP